MTRSREPAVRAGRPRWHWTTTSSTTRPGAPRLAGDRAARRSTGLVDLAEDARFIREHGGCRHASSTQIATRLGVSKSRLDKACRHASGAGRETDATVRSGKDAGAGPHGLADRGQGRVA